jgi:hypothetical protein
MGADHGPAASLISPWPTAIEHGGFEYAALPATLHVRTCRICRMVRAFGPSGLEVNSAESDSAVRYRHGEFESSHGQASSLLVCRGTV